MQKRGHQALGFQGTVVKAHVDEAYNRPGVVRGYHDDQGPYPDNMVVRGIMQALEAAEGAMAKLKNNDQAREYDCRQKMYLCGAALKAYMDYTYTQHSELPFPNAWWKRSL